MLSCGAFHEFVSFSHNLNAKVFKTDFFKKPITVLEESGIRSAFLKDASVTYPRIYI